MRFIDRSDELGLIRERMASERAEFLVVYGRRRVGKTALMMQVVAEYGGAILMGREESKKLQLGRFARQLGELFADEYVSRNGFVDWDAFFDYLASRADKGRVLVVLDEFPYLVKEDPSLPSILQERWDLRLRNTQLFLVIMGSSISMMEGLLGHKSPLYGRRTGQLRIRPFRFTDFAPLVGDPKHAVELFSVFGGTPAHLVGLELDSPLEDCISEHFGRPGSPISQDVLFLLREEFDEPRYYFSIMEAIALGNTSLGTIMNHTGLERGLVGKYLSILRELDLVRREVPVTSSSRTKHGLYSLSDNILTFWFRFVFPWEDLIELGRGAEVLRIIKRDLGSHIGLAFEDICRQAMWDLVDERYTRIGRWWDGHDEIDIVALNSQTHELAALEVKWRELRTKDARAICRSVEQKVGSIGWNQRSRTVRTGVFAQRIEGKQVLRAEGYLAFDLRDILGKRSKTDIGPKDVEAATH